MASNANLGRPAIQRAIQQAKAHQAAAAPQPLGIMLYPEAVQLEGEQGIAITGVEGAPSLMVMDEEGWRAVILPPGVRYELKPAEQKPVLWVPR